MQNSVAHRRGVSRYPAVSLSRTARYGTFSVCFFTNCLDNPNSLVSKAIRYGTPKEISTMYASDHTKWNIAKLYEDLKAIKKN